MPPRLRMPWLRCSRNYSEAKLEKNADQDLIINYGKFWLEKTKEASASVWSWGLSARGITSEMAGDVHFVDEQR